MHVEFRWSGSDQLLKRIEVGELHTIPEPGLWIEVDSQPLLVTQRRHRYALRDGRYHLTSIALEVKPQARPADAEWWNGQWVIGNPGCYFNALSPFLRCAVLPEGPCTSCGHFRKR
ncbi:MAG: DUF6464 family protein [Cyanobacteriota bacterium]|nr:DUF6464 family protein [Cyanobacteriota bacterium]